MDEKTILQINQKMDELLSITKNLYLLSRFNFIIDKYPLLSATFPSLQHAFAYELTDGNNETRFIAKNVGVSHMSISRWWQIWEEKGLTKTITEKGSQKKVFSFEQLILLNKPQKGGGENESEEHRQTKR